MKRQLIAILCLILILLPYTGVNATANDTVDVISWPKGPDVVAESAIVMEASTGLILYEKNIHTKRYPASITKILTALVAIENSSMNEIVTFSKNAIFDVDPQSSRIGIDVGEQLTMQQCLYAILLESANEVAYAVAEHVGGSISGFAEMMNEKAKSLGCLNSNFVNPHGLPDEEHVTTAYDMALISREAMKNETFRKITGTRTYTIPPTNIQPEARPMRNHHCFILKQDFFYEDAIGGKTGYTNAAKYTLVTMAKRGDLELISVVMKDDSKKHQYTDTQALFDFGFDNFSIYSIADLEANKEIQESQLFTKFNPLLSMKESPIVTDEKGYLVLPNTASFEDTEKEISFYSSGELKEGSNVIGTISYTYGGRYVGGADIIYQNEDIISLTHNASGEPNKDTTGNSSEIINDNDSTDNYSSDSSSTDGGSADNNFADSSKPNPSDAKLPKGSKGSLRPIIIGVILGIFLLLIGMYIVFVERPRIKRRKAYYRRRQNRRKYMDDDYLDL